MHSCPLRRGRGLRSGCAGLGCRNARFGSLPSRSCGGARARHLLERRERLRPGRCSRGYGVFGITRRRIPRRESSGAHRSRGGHLRPPLGLVKSSTKPEDGTSSLPECNRESCGRVVGGGDRGDGWKTLWDWSSHQGWLGVRESRLPAGYACRRLRWAECLWRCSRSQGTGSAGVSRIT